MDIVTGVAGFIGSHLAKRLLEQGEQVVGIDSLTDYYDPRRKLENVASLLDHEHFRFEILDLGSAGLENRLSGASRVFHLAGQPGVRPSWGRSFDEYVRRNVTATQALLEGCVIAAVPRLVYASSSSVYGDATIRPTHEDVLPRPVSPYGVTKLAAEHLCRTYAASHDLSIASLRLFTVYGPRQRPDMAFFRLVDAAVHGRAFTLNDDGDQQRDFTYVDDVVDAFVAAGNSSWAGVANVGAGSPVTMNEAIALVRDLCGPIEVARSSAQPGDVRHTSADITTARQAFGYAPKVTLADGLDRMLRWARQREGGRGVRVGRLPASSPRVLGAPQMT